LKGLQRQINLVEKYNKINNPKWTDLEVAEWPHEEIDLGISIQTDEYVYNSIILKITQIVMHYQLFTYAMQNMQLFVRSLHLK
jgi:hypothetical protein